MANMCSLHRPPLAGKHRRNGRHCGSLLSQEFPQVMVGAFDGADQQLGCGPVLPPLLFPVLLLLLPGSVKGLQVLPVQPPHGV